MGRRAATSKTKLWSSAHLLVSCMILQKKPLDQPHETYIALVPNLHYISWKNSVPQAKSIIEQAPMRVERRVIFACTQWIIPQDNKHDLFLITSFSNRQEALEQEKHIITKGINIISSVYPFVPFLFLSSLSAQFDRVCTCRRWSQECARECIYICMQDLNLGLSDQVRTRSWFCESVHKRRSIYFINDAVIVVKRKKRRFENRREKALNKILDSGCIIGTPMTSNVRRWLYFRRENDINGLSTLTQYVM